MASSGERNLQPTIYVRGRPSTRRSPVVHPLPRSCSTYCADRALLHSHSHADGSPQLTQTWVTTDGEHIVINTPDWTQKTKNVARTPCRRERGGPDDTSATSPCEVV